MAIVPRLDRSSGGVCDIVFVCQAEEIEQQSILLAQSIRLFGGGIASAHLHALIPIPEHIYGSVSPSTLAFLESLGVAFYYCRNPISDSYKIANKLNAFTVPSKTETIVFLDSDILVLGDFSDLLAQRRVDVLAKVAMRQWPSPLSRGYGVWERLYREFGLTVPTRRVVSPETNRRMIPYFNAGVIVCSRRANLSDVWIHVARRLDQMDIPHKYPYLDQVALPVALSLGNLDWETLPEDYNFAPGFWLLKKKLRYALGRRAWLTLPQTLSDVKMLHYHAYRILERVSQEDSGLREKLERLLDELPFERDVLTVSAMRSLARRLSSRQPYSFLLSVALSGRGRAAGDRNVDRSPARRHRALGSGPPGKRATLGPGFRSTQPRREDRIVKGRIRHVTKRNELPALLTELGLRGLGVEVGVRWGVYSTQLLANSSLEVLFSVDPWLEFSRVNYRDSANVAQWKQNLFYVVTVARLAKFEKRSVCLRMLSMEATRLFAEQSMDFVYIDANHSYASCREDIAAWWPKVKVGGLMAGHDYLDGEKRWFGHFGVKSAVDEFAAEHSLEVFVTKEKWPTWYVQKDG
jgi:hypothetical protein